MPGSTDISAFPQLISELAKQLIEAQLDHEAFETRLKACELRQCRATCCHDGVLLNREEVDTIQSIVPELGAYGFSNSDRWLTERNGRSKTATVPAGSDQLAIDYPDHFASTRCVFLDSEFKCILQRHASDQGQHPWHHKPLGCWMHPIVLLPVDRDRDRPVLTVRTHANSSGKMTDFATCTHCGRADQSGQPAFEVLHEELRTLSLISGRNLLNELTARPAP